MWHCFDSVQWKIWHIREWITFRSLFIRLHLHVLDWTLLFDYLIYMEFNFEEKWFDCKSLRNYPDLLNLGRQSWEISEEFIFQQTDDAPSGVLIILKLKVCKNETIETGIDFTLVFSLHYRLSFVGISDFYEACVPCQSPFKPFPTPLPNQSSSHKAVPVVYFLDEAQSF